MEGINKSIKIAEHALKLHKYRRTRYPKKEINMPKQKNSVMEYRNYYLPVDFPVLILSGEHWKISDIPSSRLHFHNCLEIGLCHSCSGTMKFYSEPMTFKAGDVTCIPRNIPHTTYSDKGTESRWSYIMFDPAELFRALLPASESGPELSLFSYRNYRHILPRTEYPHIHYLTQSIIDEMENTRPNYQSCVKGLLLALSIELNRIQEQANATESTCGGPTSSSGPDAVHSIPENALVISPALDYIEDHYSSQFPIEVLADLCHMSLTHFRRVFHSIMQTSPLDYLNSTRIMKACNLLRSTEESILSISEMAGFASVSNFNRHFHAVIHMTPREYRNQMLFARQKEGTDVRHTILEFSGWMEPESDPL